MAKKPDSNFETFKAECDRWLQFFGLKDWKVQYIEDNTISGYAEIRVQGIQDRCAIFAYRTKNDKQSQQFANCRKTAFHEVCELLLWPLEYQALCRYTTEEEITEKRHSIIRTLENSVYQECS